jgi:putative intracellular protease/amidase
MSERILFVVTAHDRLGDTGEKTGFHFEEMSTPYYVFQDAGYEVGFATVHGGEPPADPGSLKPRGDNPESVERFLDDDAAMSKLRSAHKIADVAPGDFAAVYVPGGHGAMWDLADQAVGSLIASAYEQGAVLGSVCHGPAAFVEARLADGTPLVKGKKINCFTNAEEDKVSKTDVVPFLLQSKLEELGARFEHAPPFEAIAVRDERIVTGQNPPSARPVAEAMLEMLKARTKESAAAV